MFARTMAAVVAALGVCVLGFWFLFGSISPCEALRNEYKRQGQEKAGLLGKAVMGIAADLNTDDMTPVECTQRAMRLRFGGKSALEDLVK